VYFILILSRFEIIRAACVDFCHLLSKEYLLNMPLYRYFEELAGFY